MCLCILVTILNRFIINIFIIVLQRYIHPCVCMSVQKKINKLVIGFPDVLKVICIIYFLSLLVTILLIHTKPSCDNETTHYNSCWCTKWIGVYVYLPSCDNKTTHYNYILLYIESMYVKPSRLHLVSPFLIAKSLQPTGFPGGHPLKY